MLALFYYFCLFAGVYKSCVSKLKILSVFGDRMDYSLIDKAMNYVKNIFADDFSGHDFQHTMRVYDIATRIALCEGADLSTVQIAALLHDVDDHKLSPRTHIKKERAVTFLKENGVTNDEISLIVSIINEVSFSENGTCEPSTLEGKCVQDADRLDALGAIGIARTFAFGGSHHRPIYDPILALKAKDGCGACTGDDRFPGNNLTSIDHFYKKLLRLNGLMNTETAKKIAVHRDAFMREFLVEFYSEVNGDL